MEAAENDVVAALTRGDPDGARSALPKVHALYQAHGEGVDRSVVSANAFAADTMADMDKASANMMWQLLALGFVSLAVAAALGPWGFWAAVCGLALAWAYVALRMAQIMAPLAIVGAAGVKHLVQPGDVKPGAAVLDVGVTRETDPETGKSKVYGDVAPDVAEVAGFVSPNPGGVGPMTVALLMTNVVEAAERSLS